ncbi:MAG: hypothetical protein MRY83_05280, partial [Flavobacteriales bacterium]|nr:hypothetical protein [Flavobacteriales bacterium]
MGFSSNINTKSEAFLQNKAKMEQLVSKLEEHYKESLSQGSEKSIQKARKRGKLLARERIELLL